MNAQTIVIAGAGEAGVAAAATLREEGCRDRILLISNEEELPYERPPLSKEALYSEPAANKLIRPEDWYAAQGIELMLTSTVISLDPRERLVEIDCFGGHKQEQFASLLIATGARPRRLPDDPPGVLYLRTRADARRLQGDMNNASHIVILGGGVIGLEVAATARSRGLAVTVVDPAERLMNRALAPEISEYLLDLHRQAGINVILGSGSIDLSRRSESRLSARVGGIDLKPDICVAGIGVVPNDDLGRMAGCALDNGILVDGYGRTTVPGIFAAGDVAAFPHPLFRRRLRVEAWQHAGRHGAHVARSICGVLDNYAEVPWFWTDQLGVNIQVAGLASDCDKTIWRGTGGRRTALHFEKDKLCGVTTIDNGRDMRPAINLLNQGWAGDPEKLTDPDIDFRELVKRQISLNLSTKQS